MLKKIILAVFLTGFIGILVWGGLNRTLAKSNDSEGRNANYQTEEHVEYADGNGVQQRANDNQSQGNAEHLEVDDAGSEGYPMTRADAVSQAASSGNGYQGDPAKETNAASADSTGNGNTGNQGNGGRGNGGQGQGGGYEPLDATEIEALHLALDDEYHALAVYQSVIAAFGQVVPFVEIAQSEQKHIDALLNQFNKNGLTIPENPWIGQIPAFESVQQACQTGFQAEIDNAGIYDQLFSMTDNPSLTRIFTNLRNASLNSHLPQFAACQ